MILQICCPHCSESITMETYIRRAPKSSRRKKPLDVYVGNSKFWANPIFEIINRDPGVSRSTIEDRLDAPISPTELSNALITLRRRGWVENRGTKKYPKWYAKNQPQTEGDI